ncbi:tetratricopeptide repeat protein [Pseudomonas sp. MAFF 730085]|uniref:Tetratricopeptide repeat protein n=1 Tax=Pseudomonas kitaguniensis TaxID=2607908 RepID=A0A5N7JSA8_9PSED|nr:tetratricopeptide repeat protein [Pseudomonas kitaguniensis]MPQ84267.1 tetratricopeptide repeat protein [Pseudomonas kitaguniensis]
MKSSKIFGFKYAVVLSCFSSMVFADDLDLVGANGATLKFSGWRAESSVWQQVSYENSNTRFSIYDPFLSNDIGVGAGISSDALAPDRSLVILQRSVFGVLNDGEQISTTEKNYCDMISLQPGCVLLTRPAQFCSGSWKVGEWITDAGEIVKPELEIISPQDLVKSVINITDKTSRKEAIKSEMFMGAQSYMACFPQKQNISALNDIGFYLANEGEHVIAMQIYKRLLDIAPSRIPLKLNTADSLWALGKRNEAKLYYAEYRDAMMQNGNRAKIPKRVESRAE